MTTEKIPSNDSNVKIANALKSDEKYIESDMDGYQVQYDDNEGAMVLAVDPAAHANTCTSHSSSNGGTEFIPWTDAEAQSQYNSSSKTASNSLPSKAGSYYLTGPVTLDAEWTPANGTTVLCLNGQTITSTKAETTFKVSSGVTFVLTDCQSTGALVCSGDISAQRQGVKVDGGSFTMYNGTVDGFSEGVLARYSTATMYGGSIVNSRDYGVRNISGTFNMYGGSITGSGSSTYFSCGVYDNGTMTVGGNATIQNNTDKRTGSSCNVYWRGGPITVNDNFTGSFGVTADTWPSVGSPKQLTAGGGTISNITNKITSDNENYETVSSGENLSLQVVKREPKAIAAPQAESGLIYNGTTQTGVLAGEGYKLTGSTAIDAGSYTATATLKEGYKWDDDTTDPKTIAWSIAKKTLTVGDFTMSRPTRLVYDGTEKPAVVTLADVALRENLTDRDFVVEYNSDSYLQKEGDLPKNVGHYTFWVKVNESSKNFTASPSGIFDTNWGFDILKANLTGIITAADFNGGYDGNEHTITVTGAPEGTTIRYNSVDTPVIGYDSKSWGFSKLGYTNAGNYTVYYRVYGDNYNTFGGSAAINITKAFPEAPTGLRGTQGQPLSTVKLPEGWTWDAPNTVMNTLGEQIFKASYTESMNYNAKANVDVTVTVTDKETVAISGLTYANKTYDGKAIAPAGTLTVADNKVPAEELKVLYESTDSKGYSKTEAPKDAGAYKVTYKVADSNERYIGSVTYDFIISPKAVTAAPANKTMTKGSAIPAFELTYKGLVTSETLTPSVAPTFSCYEKDTTPVTTNTAAGTYTITWTNMEGTTFDNGNYAVTTSATGTLTISNRSTGGGGGGGGASVPTYPVSSSNASASAAVGGSVSASTKNATAGSTVTVTVSPEAGYRLEKLTVVDKNGKEIPVTLKDGKYTFTMPASQVEIKPVFEKIPAETAEPTFPDVPSSAYYAEPVKWAAEKGITSGTKDGGFAPGNTCTRAQIVTFLWRAAGSPEPQTAETGMTDVSPAAYYAKAVAWAIENGITVGRSDGSFNPNGTCTRANGVTFLYRAAKAAASGNDAGFSDVTADAYYAAAVQWALENGITNGQSNGLFGPNGACTRAQIVTFLYRLYVKA
ncbi:S-layer homology domain-containing protein [uncultured Oscillibacter sp.]|uniref:S-layer homology domain-containing protein n=1 Tax=uncultured Oscillibacter sp. TaxID=876091 RepID=UPI0025F27193|nr:S-layer homology domain-containing protein [uncultured Oscillibacter sp.]